MPATEQEAYYLNRLAVFAWGGGNPAPDLLSEIRNVCPSLASYADQYESGTLTKEAAAAAFRAAASESGFRGVEAYRAQVLAGPYTAQADKAKADAELEALLNG